MVGEGGCERVCGWVLARVWVTWCKGEGGEGVGGGVYERVCVGVGLGVHACERT